LEAKVNIDLSRFEQELQGKIATFILETVRSEFDASLSGAIRKHVREYLAGNSKALTAQIQKQTAKAATELTPFINRSIREQLTEALDVQLERVYPTLNKLAKELVVKHMERKRRK